MQRLTEQELNTPAAMLETLQQAYRHMLDRFPNADGSEKTPEELRLTEKEQYELGHRLAQYWLMEPRLKCKPYNPPAHLLMEQMRAHMERASA